jgi:hypothetical protein
MHKTLNTKKFLLVCLLALPSLAAAQHRAALGPVEAFGKSSSTITVLGQTFAISDATRIAINGRQISAGEVSNLISRGQRVYVEGIDLTGQSLATSIDVVRDPYVAGATAVHLLGKISEFSPTSGFIRIGSLRIDSTSIDPELMGKLQVGSTVQISGIQPSPNGRVVGPIQLSIAGSGLRVESIGGSGAQVQSIGGSGKFSIGGSGAQIKSIGGSGKLSIGGSGTQLQSIGGSGTQLQSIGGSGTQLQSIGGSGTQLQSIGGSGKLSIGGSGAQLQSIGGSGTLSIGGSGTQLQSIGGSGTLSIGGSGKQIQSIGGSGNEIQSIGGSGIQTRSIGGSGLQ